MPDKDYFEILIRNVGDHEIRFRKYPVPSLAKKPKKIECICGDDSESKKQESIKTTDKQAEISDSEQQILKEALRTATAADNFEALTDIIDLEQPKVVIWNYMSKKELTDFLSITDQQQRRKIIGDKLGSDYIKGICRVMIIELIMAVADLCIKSNFDIEETASVLSIFYLTHRYFTTSLYRTAQEVYDYFKEFLFCVTVSCPPESIQLLSYEKSKEVLIYFCKIYLRNLPLIRLLCCPNYGFFIDYHVEPDEIEELLKSQRKSKGKEKGKGKGKKGKKK